MTATHDFVLTGYSDNTTTGLATVREFDRAARLARAFRALGLWWLVAAVSVFIPVAHFLLVPGFALFGLFVFLKRFRTTSMAESVTGVCPDCGHEQLFEVEGSWTLPRDLQCGDCRRILKAAVGN